MLKQIFVEGRIPHFMLIKKILFWLALIVPFSIFLMPQNFRDFSQIGWITLICVLAVRPLADIFPDIKILRTLAILRREFGVFSGMMILAHFTGFLLINNIFILNIFTEKMYWDYKGFVFWGILGLLMALVPLLTSNKFSMLKLKSAWKEVQKVSYLFLLFGGIHIYLIGEESGLVGIIIVAVLWTAAEFKFKISFKKTLSP